jgi:Fe-S cluster biogenesis protein NfuA
LSALRGLLGRLLGRADPGEGVVPSGDPERVAEVQAALDELRPLLRADGGDAVLLAVEDGRVRLRFVGACSGCAASSLTLRGALEPRLRERLPWVTDVRAE